jgi:predicted Zn finger-like uncharacterized protein
LRRNVPHCQTTFRVAHDQLKLRAGLVRCGHCKEIFNGIEHLLPPERPASPAAAPPATAESSAEFSAVSDPVQNEQPMAATEESVDTASSVQTEQEQTVEIDKTDNLVADATPTADEAPPASRLAFDISATFEREFPAPASFDDEIKPTDPLLRMTLMDFTSDLPDSTADASATTNQYSNAEESVATFAPHEPDELDEAIENLQRKPWRRSRTKSKVKTNDQDAAAEELDEEEHVEDEPSFIKHGRRRQRIGRKLRNVLIAGSFFLLLAALAQGTYVFRNQLAGMFPQTKPLLTQACDMIGCRINLPAQITAVSIESSELQTLADNQNRFVLTTLVRNNSNTLQEWPYIELTLNDGNEKALLRRVFKPSDYLDASDVRFGFPASSERTAKLAFELQQVKASGYRVYLFYP